METINKIFLLSRLSKTLIMLYIFVAGVLVGITWGYPTDLEMVEYFSEIDYICFNNNQDCYQMVKIQ